jgi:hypothetical protein
VEGLFVFADPRFGPDGRDKLGEIVLMPLVDRREDPCCQPINLRDNSLVQVLLLQ